jgi:hypothetical protein
MVDRGDRAPPADDGRVEWERANLADRGDYGLVVVLNKFCQSDAPPVTAKPVQKPASVISVVLPGIDGPGASAATAVAALKSQLSGGSAGRASLHGRLARQGAAPPSDSAVAETDYLFQPQVCW